MTDKWHGTTGGYINHKCRDKECECRVAWAQYTKGARVRRAEEVSFEEIPHGLNGYTNYKCRCEECRAAHALYSRERRSRNREKKDLERTNSD